jgi:hypothetical protein
MGELREREDERTRGKRAREAENEVKRDRERERESFIVCEVPRSSSNTIPISLPFYFCSY